jgi:hypothetical protein
MGVSEPQELDQDEETVILKVRFPGLLHSLAHTGSYPSHCWSQGSGGGQANQQTDFNGGILKSTHYVLKGSISSGINNSSLKIGSNYRLRGGLSHVVQ